MVPQVIAAAILSGGQARRFLGRDKGRLVAGADGRTILERQLDVLAPLVQQIVIVTSQARLPEFDPKFFPVEFSPLTTGKTQPGRISVKLSVVVDHYPGEGPLGAVLTALEIVDPLDVLAIAGDMPDISGPFVRDLISLHERSGYDVTAAESSRGVEPLAAIYGRAAYPVLRASFAGGERALHRALRLVRLGLMPADETNFRNINAPEDLR